MKQWRVIIIILGLVMLTVSRVQAADLEFNCNEKNCDLTPKNVPFFAQKNALPGASYHSILQVKNNSNLVGTFSLQVKKVSLTQSSPDLAKVMTFEVNQANDQQPVVSALPIAILSQIREPLNLGQLQPGQTRIFELIIKFDSQAGNEYQGKELNFNLDLTGQLDVGLITPPPFITPVVKPPNSPAGQVLGVTRQNLAESWWWWLLIWLVLIIFLILFFRRRRRRENK